jgi:branched-chain amino acid aminotransferase
MNEGARAWLDGALVPAAELADLAGPGVFETLRADARALHFVAEHLARLAEGARRLALPWPPPTDPRRALAELSRALPPAELALRLEWRPPHLAVSARAPARPPAEPVLLVPSASAPLRPFGAKTVARAAYAELRAEAERRGAFEALVHTKGDRAGEPGELVEGTVTNLFLARGGELLTPPLASGALPGIVRGALLTELEQVPLSGDGRRWTVRAARLGLADLAAAEEVLLTNSLVRVLGVGRIEGAGLAAGLARSLPGPMGPVARALAACALRLEAARAEPRFPGAEPG